MEDVHVGTTCAKCATKDIKGLLHTCLVCWNYDLCQTCYTSKSHNAQHRPHHPMQQILEQEVRVKVRESVISEDLRRFCCPFCGEKDHTVAGLVEHCQQNHLEDSDPVRCPVCVAFCLEELDLLDGVFLEHLKSEHHELAAAVGCVTCRNPIQDERFACLICANYAQCSECHKTKKFNKQHLPYHPMQQIKTVAQQPDPAGGKFYRCPYCGDDPFTVAELVNHCQELHQQCQGIRVRCPICGLCRVPYKTFRLLKGTLLEHLVDYHGKVVAQEPEPALECIICYENLATPCKKYCQCDHEQFHDECIQHWLQLQNTCPYCRAAKRPG